MMRRLLLLPLLCLATPAMGASCTAANGYTLAFADQPATTLSYGGTYSYTATSGAGATQTVAVAVTQNGMTSTVVNGVQLPAIGTLVTGPDATRRDLVLGGIFGGRTTSLTSGTRVVTVTFTFAQPVRDVAITLHDVDYTINQYRDWIMLSGSTATQAYPPVLTTPWGNGNGAGVARTAAQSSVTVGATATPILLATDQAAGSGASGNNSDVGTITASFAQPVTRVTLRYGNHPLNNGETTTGQQGMGVASIRYCPMPTLAVSKTSAPWSGPSGKYNLPGTDLVYTVAVTNSGGSEVDLGSLVLTDVLPSGVIFRNAPFDAATLQPFKSSMSTTTSPPGLNAAYSSDGGATWNYTPQNGYDKTVKAIRLQLTGTIPANSVFSVQFVAIVQ